MDNNYVLRIAARPGDMAQTVFSLTDTSTEGHLSVSRHISWAALSCWGLSSRDMVPLILDEMTTELERIKRRYAEL